MGFIFVWKEIQNSAQCKFEVIQVQHADLWALRSFLGEVLLCRCINNYYKNVVPYATVFMLWMKEDPFLSGLCFQPHVPCSLLRRWVFLLWCPLSGGSRARTPPSVREEGMGRGAPTINISFFQRQRSQSGQMRGLLTNPQRRSV